jgi:hypothetical protein
MAKARSETLFLKRFLVMPGLVPGIHDFAQGKKNVDGRDKPGHDDLIGS